jgi:cytochrome P450 monooxygenase
MVDPEALPSHVLSEKPHVLDVCPHVREVRDTPPVRQVRTFVGDKAWMVTGHAEVKRLFSDHRLGRSHPDPANKPQFLGHEWFDLAISDDHAAADEMHAHDRSVLKPLFAIKHMEHLRPQVGALVDEMVDGLIGEGPPADLHEELGVPLVRAAFGKLLGVPSEDQQKWTGLMTHPGDDDASKLMEIPNYLRELATHKRQNPGPDVISRLCAVGLSDEDVGLHARTLLLAGFGAIVFHIDHGVLLRTREPEKFDALTRDPALLPAAVEELLRISGGGVSLPRYAREDIEIGGVTIRANELVMLDLTLVNLDENVFDRPECLDLTRTPNRHLTFAHGMSSCLGAPFARLVLQSVFPRLFSRLPNLRLAIPEDQLRKNINGFIEFPVIW